MNLNHYVKNICDAAKRSKASIGNLSTNEKNKLLKKIAGQLREKSSYIISENAKDMKAADEAGLTSAMKDRLFLDTARINSMADSVDQIAMLADPVGTVSNMRTMPSGIRVGQMRVPLGVVAVIFESRPNVTSDIAALCIKSGNVSILRGGKEAIHSNMAIHSIIKDCLNSAGLPVEVVTLVETTDRDLVPLLLRMNDYIDIVIPRGGEALVKMVSEISTIPVIKHDKGVCHIFIDESAEFEMARDIAVNAKVQRPGVCNAMETMLVHEKFLSASALLDSLIEKNVEIRGCEKTVKLMNGKVRPASDADWDAEYLELILAVKIVSSIDDAIEHISKHSSNHSEAIVTTDYFNAERFLKEVDSSAIFVNASTRFHDGGEFGLGAEVGISTQKLHARGAMGIEGLTCLKYIVYGNGETR